MWIYECPENFRSAPYTPMTITVTRAEGKTAALVVCRDSHWGCRPYIDCGFAFFSFAIGTIPSETNEEPWHRSDSTGTS